MPVFLSSGLCCVIGGHGSGSFFSMPRMPSANTAASAKYGFMSAPGTRTSKRVAAAGTDGGAMMRMDAARES